MKEEGGNPTLTKKIPLEIHVEKDPFAEFIKNCREQGVI